MSSSIDPRLTRTAAHATEYVRLRPGTDIPVLYGMMWHIIKNGWEDKEFIAQRVYGFDDVQERDRKMDARGGRTRQRRAGGTVRSASPRCSRRERPATLIWCMGQTQHTVGTANVRASCIALLLTGNVGKPGTGANIFRGHDNVQGATDVGLDVVTLPFYYGLAEGAWRHWSRVWEVDYDYLQSRFDSKKIMETAGIPLTRWFDAVLLPKDQVDQKDNVRAMFVQGHASNSITRIPESLKALAKLELLVVADPHPTTWASLAVDAGRKDDMYLLPACTQFEAHGLAGRVEPLAAMGRADRQADLRVEERSRDHVPDGQEARLRRQDVQEHQGREQPAGGRGRTARDEPRLLVDRLLRPVAGASQAAHGEPEGFRSGHDAGRRTARPKAIITACRGRAGASPRSSIRARRCSTIRTCTVMDGGGTFRARFGVERNGVNLLAEGSYSVGSEIKDGYPEFTDGRAEEARLGRRSDAGRVGDRSRRSPAARTRSIRVSWSIDLSGGIQRVALKHGCVPYGNAQGAHERLRNLPDPIPVHREPIYTPRARPGREISDPARRQAVPAAEYRLHGAEGGGRQGHRQAVPADPELRPAGRIRRRRRGDPLQQMARRTAAGHVHRDQPGRCAARAASRTAPGSG